MNAIRPYMLRLRTELNDRELWCLCIIGALLWTAN